MEEKITVKPLLRKTKILQDGGRITIPKAFREMLTDRVPVVELILCEGNQVLIRKIEQADK